MTLTTQAISLVDIKFLPAYMTTEIQATSSNSRAPSIIMLAGHVTVDTRPSLMHVEYTLLYRIVYNWQVLLWSHTLILLSEVAAVMLAEAHPEFVVGVVCRQRLSTHPNIIHMTPGKMRSTIMR